MTELADTSVIETDSTKLEENVSPGVSGAGAPKLAPEEPTSLRDTLADELKKDDESRKEDPQDDADTAKRTDGDEDGETEGKADKGDKDDAKPKEKAKAKPDVKADDAKVDDAPAAKTGDGEDSEEEYTDNKGNKYPKAIARMEAFKGLMPDAKEKWNNTPHAVKRDIENMVRGYQSKVEHLTKATERYENLRQFDELAQSNGWDLTESLTKMHEIENLMQSNPYAGLNAILQEIGPRKNDGSPISFYEVAQFVAQQGPDKWQQMVAQQPQNQQQQEDPRVAQLQQQLVQMQVQQTAQSVIEPFKAAHPRYEELKGPIAQILKSDMVPTSLSAPDRLAVAYDMAERLNPPSDVRQPATQASPDADARVDTDLSGTKSIKSAPGSSSPDLAPERGGSIADILREESRRQRRA